MKRLLLVLLLFCGCIRVGFAQSSLEQYCELYMQHEYIGKKYNAKIIYGNNPLIVSSDKAKIEMKFDEIPDALNYLGALGWKLANSVLDTNGAHIFIFKKEFIKAEEKPVSTN